jgi:hypothetical protein
LSIKQNFDGIPNAKKDFFENIFYPCYALKIEPDFIADGAKKETKKVVTTKDIYIFYKKN